MRSRLFRAPAGVSRRAPVRSLPAWNVAALVLAGCAAAPDQAGEAQGDDDIHHYELEAYFDLAAGDWGTGELINRRLDGYRGIWYKNTDLDNEYVYKYSGGLGTDTDYHDPFAVYSPEVDKTFFVFGGTDEANSTLFHMVSYFDHETGMVPRPVLVLDKRTDDAHDNPVVQIDEQGYI